MKMALLSAIAFPPFHADARPHVERPRARGVVLVKPESLIWPELGKIRTCIHPMTWAPDIGTGSLKAFWEAV